MIIGKTIMNLITPGIGIGLNVLTILLEEISKKVIGKAVNN